ncbi:melanotransferrin isoform X2 [Protopterus annectens]|uniref:melanotransferrin isoform X2 n=1 Tax=Protopterus annectens TaxID=7888 RepID=UPI001CF9F801|nr:melanotransferrin isoform X2 [Protopterus annectens]
MKIFLVVSHFIIFFQTGLPQSLRWCTESSSEMAKCKDMANAFTLQNLVPKIQCESAQSPEDCMVKIQGRTIDAVTLDGGHIYIAGKKYGLVPAAGESYADSDGTTYYTVAVVKKNDSVFSINELKGKKSCHTGYQRTAGWNIPIGFLIQKGFISANNCDIVNATSQFFSKSCVPGANQNGFPSNLCALCIGDDNGNNKCALSNKERYSGYSGAFRCLVESAGDVAFVKQTTVNENTDGNNAEPWAANLNSSDFALLCPDGTRKEVHQYIQCNMAQVPAHAVMVHPGININSVFGLLDRAQAFFGNDSNIYNFSMFDSSKYNGSDLIFKDSTIKIVSVGGKTTYEKWLGEQYTKILQQLDCSGAKAVMKSTFHG